MKKQDIIKIAIAMCIFVAGVFVGKNLQEVLQKRAADALAIEMMEQEMQEQQEKEEQDKDKIDDDIAVVKPEKEPSVSENKTSSENEVDKDAYKPTFNATYDDGEGFISIAERLATRSSYDETLLINAEDKEIIDNCTLDFSNMRIACMGDSLTEGVDGVTPYPELLQATLGAKEVINLGIGGSTLARIEGVSSIVDRAESYDEDIDLLIIMAGSNDNFYQAEWAFGDPYSTNNNQNTFCGGLALIMDQRKNKYPDVPVMYIMPPANAVIDELRADEPGLLPQEKYAEAYRKIGADRGIEITDLFNMNFMNSHDESIRSDFMVDLAHFNSKGNQVLAERIASEIIVRYTE